jgi:hypothetical protein
MTRAQVSFVEERVKMPTRSAFLAVVLSLTVVHTTVFAQVTFYTDMTAWLAAVTNTETFPFTASNVQKADEVTSLPGNNAQLGSALTFAANNTGLSRSFTLQALQSGANLVYNDTEFGSPLSFGTNTISIGDIDNHENDDWQVTMTSGPALTAFGFDLLDNAANAGELFSVYGPGNVLYGSLYLQQV